MRRPTNTTLITYFLLLVVVAVAQRKTNRNVPVGADVKQGVDFNCPEEFGYYPHSTDCTQYYVCVFGGALLESCTGGLMYSHELQTCDWPRNVGCDAPAEVSNSAPSINERIPTASVAPQRHVPEQRISRPPTPAPHVATAVSVSSRGQPRQLHRNERLQDEYQLAKQNQQQLYQEADDALLSIDENESDSPQRVYRGQPSTVGQVQRDRDAIRHTNAIPAPARRAEKISVISFGTQRDQQQQLQQTQKSQPVQQYRVESSTLGPESYDNLNLNTYNSSEQYDTSQYDPYYGLYDDGVDLYRDIDYGHNYNTANKQPTPSQQTVYRGTPATSAPQVEIVTQRKSTQYIQPASNYNNRPHVENNAYNGASNAATHSTNSGASNVASHDHGDVYELSVGHDYVDIDDVPIQNTHPGRQPVRGQNRNELTFDAVQPSTVATSSTTITTPRPQTTTTTSTTTQRTPTRGRGSAYHSTAGDTPATVNRGTPAASRSRPTLKPSTSIVSKATEFIDIYKYPPRRPETVYPTPQVDKTAAKCRKDVCLLPDCSCGGREIPGGLPVEEVPQIVLITFDDAVNDLNKYIYSDLFEHGRVNPNGCPISATFYVSHEWTDYSQVQNLYADGHEMASHTVSHSFGEQFSQKKWNREVAGQREILSAYGGVKLEDIRGMRAPFLSVGGNKMFKMLYDSNFTYDSSMPIYENKPPSWPYTLDYKIFHDCMIPPCPTRSYPGVWEVPMVMWQDLNGGRCSMGDACSNPSEADGVFKMLMKNFDRHYTSNRAPFGLFYHAAWFTQPHHKEGFIHFLDTINAMKDVYLITNWQAIQWVRDPTPLSRIANFQPFQCDYPNRPKRCNNPKVCNLWHKSGVRYMRTCQPCPDIYPWTGKTGIKSSRIDNDIDD